MKKLYTEGQVIGQLTYIRDVIWHNRKHRRALFRCKCGVEFESLVNHVKREATISCGCHKRTHNLSGTSEHRIWCSMKRRCTKESCKEYKYYGGRGIIVCDRWLNSFKNFLEDMGERPSLKHSIERENNDGNYEPSNCKWATRTIQSRNTRRNIYLTYKNETKCLSEWCESLNLSYWPTLARVKDLKWPIEKAFETPFIRGRNQYSNG